MDLEKRVQEECDACRVLIEDAGECRPHVAHLTEDGERVAFLCGELVGSGWKDMVSYVIRKLLRAPETVAVLFATEAWTVRTECDEHEARALAASGSLKDHPDRVEVVLLAVYQPDQPDRMYRAEIRRGEGRAWLGDWEPLFDESEGPVKGQGRFLDLGERANEHKRN